MQDGKDVADVSLEIDGGCSLVGPFSQPGICWGKDLMPARSE
jgi:hypothetical protein